MKACATCWYWRKNGMAFRAYQDGFFLRSWDPAGICACHRKLTSAVNGCSKWTLR